ncbi:hypothetical protein ACLB1E_03845 [Escherichia coli]
MTPAIRTGKRPDAGTEKRERLLDSDGATSAILRNAPIPGWRSPCANIYWQV